MTCLDEDSVLAFCAGTLAAPARARAEEHLAGCDECRVLVSAVARSSLAMPAGALGKRPSAATPLLGSTEVGPQPSAVAASRAGDPLATQAAGQGVRIAVASGPPVPGAPVVRAGAGLDAMAPTTPVSAARGASGPRAGSDRPTPIASPVQPGEVLGGKFLVESILGAGGMGVVVAARHTQLDQRVALKFLLPQACEVPGAVARFLQEGKASARISSEHVARVVDTGVLDTGAPYLVMEYLEGKDLGAVLAQRKRLPWPEAVEYVLQACEAIAEAHDLGIVHRDLKPANLFLTSRADGSPLVKVLDFGISKIEGAGTRGGLTSTSMLMGSPRYMSPEQMMSAKDVDARTDVWALGVILFELVTGRPVWSADTVQGLCALIASAPAPPLRAVVPGVPDALEDTVLRALVKVRDARLASVADLARALAPIAPPQALVSVDRIQRVAARGGGRISASPSRPPLTELSPGRTPPAGAHPSNRPPMHGASVPPAASTTGAASPGGRATLVLASLVGLALVAGLAANAYVGRPSATAPASTTTAATATPTPTPTTMPTPTPTPATVPSAAPSVLVIEPDPVPAAAPVVPVSTAPRPRAVAGTPAIGRRPPSAPATAALPAATPTASPAPGTAPVDTSRALVERK